MKNFSKIKSKKLLMKILCQVEFYFLQNDILFKILYQPGKEYYNLDI